MNDVERVIGSVQEAARQMERRLDKVEDKIDTLMNFKWRVAGGAAALSVVLTGLVELFHKFKS